MENIAFYKMSIGLVGIAEIGGAITEMFLVKEHQPVDRIGQETSVLKEASKQLQEYLDGKREEFCLPLAPEGTNFQKTVWTALREIPYGETRSYKQIAEAIGQPNSCRAVGMANNRNPILILIPCHRVIGANGKLVGYAAGLEVKEKLLKLEKSHAKG